MSSARGQQRHPVSGLTPAEEVVSDALARAMNAFEQIPESVTLEELQAFRGAIEAALCVLQQRIVRRLYGAYWSQLTWPRK